MENIIFVNLINLVAKLATSIYLPAESRGCIVGLTPLEIQSGLTRPDGPGLAGYHVNFII